MPSFCSLTEMKWMLICFSQEQSVISKLWPFANKGKFMLFNSIRWNWEVSWQIGGGVCRALLPQYVPEPRASLCGEWRTTYLPHTSFGSLNLSMAFVCSKIVKYETCWEVANWKTPAYKKTPILRASARRWEVEPLFEVKHSLAFWPTPLHRK